MTTALINPVDNLTRREFITGLTAAGLLAACGGDRRDGAPPPEADTITVTNKFGTFKIPVDPQRVVGLEGRRDFETAIALGLGIAAVGTNALDEDTGEVAPYIDFDLSSVEVIVQGEPNLELIASLRPDLILTRDSELEQFEAELRALAPLIPVGGSDNTEPWRPELERIAAELGREEQVSKVLGAYDDEVADVRDRHAERIDSAVVAVVAYGSGNLASSSTDGFLLQAHTLAELGGTLLPFLAELPANEFGIGQFSIEQIGELAAADAILLIVNTNEQRAELEANPLWQRLPAVQQGRVVVSGTGLNYGSVYAATACVGLLNQLYATLA